MLKKILIIAITFGHFATASGDCNISSGGNTSCSIEGYPISNVTKRVSCHVNHVVFYIKNNTNQSLQATLFQWGAGGGGWFLTSPTLILGLIPSTNALDFEYCDAANSALGGVTVGPYSFTLENNDSDIANSPLLNYQIASYTPTSNSSYTWRFFSPGGSLNTSFTAVDSEADLNSCTSDICGWFNVTNCSKGHGCNAEGEIFINILPSLPPAGPLGPST